MASNGDTDREFIVGGAKVVGVGSFHKTLRHNPYGEVRRADFKRLVAATRGTAEFANVPKGDTPSSKSKEKTALLVNPQAGLADDQLTHHPVAFNMPPAPHVLSDTAAAEMTELYWMALLRDVPFDQFADPKCGVSAAVTEIYESSRLQFRIQTMKVG